MRWPFLVRYSSNRLLFSQLHMDFAATLEYMLDMYEHTNDRFIIGMYVKKENLTAHKYFYYSKQLKVKSPLFI